jgi:hypothetical protein
VALSDRPALLGFECVRADEIVHLSFEDVRFPVEVTIAWNDTLARRVVERRTVQLGDGTVQLGPRTKASMDEGAWPCTLAS